LLVGAAAYYLIPFFASAMLWHKYEEGPETMLLFLLALVAGAALAGHVAARYSPKHGLADVAIRAASMVGIGFAAGGVVALGSYLVGFVDRLPVEPFTYLQFLLLALPLSFVVAIAVGAFENGLRMPRH
jgi:hypothetical protein